MLDVQFDERGEARTDKNVPIVRFWVEAIQNKGLSEKEGRPIFKNVEMVEVIMPADRNRTLKAPAHAEAGKHNGIKYTYAQKYAKQYERFKADQPQLVEGTPLAEAPFLDAAQRATLKALSVYTIEQLASLQGVPLKNLGPGGLEMQQKALTYMERASGSAAATAQAAEIARLKQTVADLSAAGADPRIKYAEMGDNELKDYIREQTGSAPRGNPSRATLVRMCVEIDSGQTPADALGGGV